MLCPSCDTPNRDDAKFCKKCGHPFRTEPANALAAGEQAHTPPAGGEAPLEPAAAAEPNPASPGSTVATQISQASTNDYAQAQAVNDVSQAPTLILTPEQMMAYHSRRWQQEAEREQAAADIADMPTVLDSPAASEADAIPPSPSPAAGDEGDVPATSTGKEQAVETSVVDTSNVAHGTTEEEESESMQPLSDQPGTTEPATDFSTLAVGATVMGRYEITQVVSESAQEHLYQVIDHEGYQRCWNCASEHNAQGDEFCMSCGAELLNAPYTMHEYPATASSEADAHVLHGTIINTFVDQGHTYVIEQQQVAQNAFPEGVYLEATSKSDAGDVRRSEPNEDSTLVLMFQRVHESISEPVGVFIVADGLGGHDNGQVASRMTIALIAERMARELLADPLANEKAGESAKPFDEDEYVALLKSAVEDANTALCQVNERDKIDMGSTITGFIIVGDHAYIINVGDSRTYMLRGGQLYKLTNDHSLVEQLVAGGLIEPDEVYTHPQRSQIFRSLGDKLNVQIDIFKQQLHPGDIMLSCSDGLWEMVRNPQIESILNMAPDPQTASAQLIDAANANGGEDNISAVVVFAR